MTQHMYTQPRAFANQFLWSQALARFGSLHQAKRARFNTSMPKLEPMFVPHMPPTILPRAIAPMINPFTGTFPGGKANLFTNAMQTRKNAVCRNFGSVRCSKCNKFGLSGECCKAYYYVVIRSKKVPREIQKQIAQTAFESFNEAESFRVEVARKYKKMRRKRKRQPQIETAKLNKKLETPLAKQNLPLDLQQEPEKPAISDDDDVPKCALSEQEKRIKIAAESLLVLDRPVVRPSSPSNRSNDEQISSNKFSLTPPRPFEDSSVANFNPSPLTVVPNGFPSTQRAMNSLSKHNKSCSVHARTILQPSSKLCLKKSLLQAKKILMSPYLHYPCPSYSGLIPQYHNIRAHHYM